MASEFAGFVLGFVLFSVCFAIAEEGSHPAEFLSLGVGARALGMGGMFVVIFMSYLICSLLLSNYFIIKSSNDIVINKEIIGELN